MDVTTPEVVGGAAVAVAAGVGLLAARAWRRRNVVPQTDDARPAPTVGPAGRDVGAALAATGRKFRERLDAALGRRDEELFQALEEALLAADVGARTTQVVL